MAYLIFNLRIFKQNIENSKPCEKESLLLLSYGERLQPNIFGCRSVGFIERPRKVYHILLFFSFFFCVNTEHTRNIFNSERFSIIRV